MKIAIKAEPRKLQGTGASRRLRRTDKVPGILYGGGKDATPIELDHKDLFFKLKQEKDRLEAAENERREAAQGLAAKLEQVQLTFSARVGDEGKLFGSVTASDIAAQLESQGFHLEKRQIDLHEPIKALGVYRVPIRLHADVKPEVRVWVIKQ